MKRKICIWSWPLWITLSCHMSCAGQAPDKILSLTDALEIASANYLIHSKMNYTKSSAEAIQTAKKAALPDFILAAQNAYGTLNGMSGLVSGLSGVTTISTPVNATPNLNASFGAFYNVNINMNVFSFGLQRAYVASARGQYEQDRADLRQTKFDVQTTVIGLYLNLLTAQRLRMVMQDNVDRISRLREIILARTINGLNPGVDSSIADAELSTARMSLTDAENYEQSQASQLSIEMGVKQPFHILDSSFVTKLPKNIPIGNDTINLQLHPVLRYLDSRVNNSDLTAAYIHKTSMPRFSFFAVGQERGSGFGSSFTSNPNDYSTNYLKGVDPVRANYFLGIGVAWNITDLTRVKSKVLSQRYISAGYKDEYNQAEIRYSEQLKFADQQISNTLSKYKEVPIQLKSARDAYNQKKALYENGLTNIVDVTQTLFFLNQAEAASNIACSAVWQALLYKAVSAGDISMFLLQF
ncbi:MAG: TolC family protein [Bacteroidota bacterium]|nr:TolC family protein [Bacteroidota bacterium]